MKKYYFISYVNTNGKTIIYDNDLIEEHPLKWQVQKLRSYESNELGNYEYRLLSWQEISLEEYINFSEQLER